VTCGNVPEVASVAERVKHSKEVSPVKKFAITTQVVSFRDAAMLLAGPTSGAVPLT
jgi:hypothetical protein